MEGIYVQQANDASEEVLDMWNVDRRGFLGLVATGPLASHPSANADLAQTKQTSVQAAQAAIDAAAQGGANSDIIEALRALLGGLASDAVSQGNVPIYATVAGLSALSIPIGISALRTNGYSAVGDGGAWPLAVEVENSGVVAPWQILSNGDKRRWQLKAYEIVLEMFGGRPDAVYAGTAPNQMLISGTDNVPAIQAALAYLATLNTSRNGGGRIQLEYGQYYFSKPVNLKNRTHLVGRNAAGTAGDFCTEMIFPQNSDGITINGSETVDDRIQAPGTSSAGGSLIECVSIRSLGGADRTKHGIRVRSRSLLRDVNVINFPGNGIHIVAGSKSKEPDRRGNANFWRIERGYIAGNQHGVFVDSSDVNGGYGIGLTCYHNRGAGILDSSFLGCDWFACGAHGNGLLSCCSYKGNRYYAVSETSAELQKTEPGTNERVWALEGPGGVVGRYRDWTLGNKLEWLRGGPIVVSDDNSSSTVFGGYLGEPNQPPAVFSDKNMSLGGFRGAGSIGNGLQVGNGVATNFKSLATSGRVDIANSASGVSESLSLHNGGDLNRKRGASIAFYVSYKEDGATKRPAGSIVGRATGKQADCSTAIDLVYFDGARQALVTSASFGERGIMAGADTAFDLGSNNARWTNGYIQRLRPGDGDVFWTSGDGSPEGKVEAPVGSLYTRTDGAPGTTLYVKEAGTNNTGWVAK